MPYLLNIAYLLLLVCVSPYLLYSAVRKGKYREGWAARFLGRVSRRDGERPCIWLHAVSVGEVNLLEPLLAQFAQEQPSWECVISTTTRTGYALARKKYSTHSVFYCPLDFTWAVRQAMRRVRPDLLVLAELELWPNLIQAARRQGAKVAVVNGRLSEHSFRGYRRVRPLVRRMLRKVDFIAVQNQQYADRFLQLGARADTLRVTGSIKFDGAQTDRDNVLTRRLRTLWAVGPEDPVFLAGSTQEPEERLAVEAFREVLEERSEWRLIVVPRHPERFAAVATMLDQSGLAWQRRSLLDTSAPDPRARILLVDAVGELGAWWAVATIGFVGGSLGRRGGQNMIEPAACGVAVAFGPNTWNFRDIVAMLLARQASVVVQNGAELTRFVRQCVERPDYAQRLGQAARELVIDQQGATARTVECLLPLVCSPRAEIRPTSHHAA